MTFDPVEILRVLNAHGVRYAVVGGFALAAHGVVRATEDLDLVPDRGLDNARALADALTSLKGQASEPLEPEVLVRGIDLKVTTRAGAVHLLRAVAGIPTYRDLDRELVEIDGVEFEVPTREALEHMKRAAGRDKDLVDLAELEALERAAEDEPG